ncbi:hypothetical protein DQ04_09981000 [Trypanosoma grayi]|uniref:hypothetical protein n=1 Tax=Trypanosoma grayi TaxID=71804 RepID=UPI0004F41B3B|nr:hypothetical protein DQ04_09981000 [Trypanosoma grayi]KEG07379.1 hypothetical protein DQ04_09981000 [Trypanosoma grayi]
MPMLYVRKVNKIAWLRRRFLCVAVLCSVAVVLFVLLTVLPSYSTAGDDARGLVLASDLNSLPHGTSHRLKECDEPRRSFQPMGNFVFWGRVMNTSAPCPTSGMNNQLMMIMGKLHCFAVNESKHSFPAGGASPVALFKWKDISCSPTGGKEGRQRYAVGGEDYAYSWFRWSELLDFADVRLRLGSGDAVGHAGVNLLSNGEDSNARVMQERASEEHITRVCLSDTYSWSEQPALAACPASVDHIWGTPVYWDLRRSLQLHPWFYRAAVDFLRRQGVARAPSQEHLHTMMALHVRRGDYQKFCSENARGRGRHKYRVPPFVYLKRRQHPNVTVIGNSFEEACFPSLQHVVAAVARVAATHAHITTVLLVTNAASFRQKLAKALRSRPDTSNLTLLSFVPASSEQQDGEHPPPYWLRHATYYTTAEAAWMDTTLISLAQVMVLNRYSTFSHSAVDVHILRETRLAANLFWW